MGMKNLSSIVENLLIHGRNPDTPVALIQWGTRTDQRVVTGTLKNILENVKAARLGPPAIIVVGEVVKLREKLNWYESKPLFGKRIVVTRSRDQASFPQSMSCRPQTGQNWTTL
jgi:uroporphyrinogen III methyltransferase/synthase